MFTQNRIESIFIPSTLVAMQFRTLVVALALSVAGVGAPGVRLCRR
jgi:hypothetical protein